MTSQPWPTTCPDAVTVGGHSFAVTDRAAFEHGAIFAGPFMVLDSARYPRPSAFVTTTFEGPAA